MRDSSDLLLDVEPLAAGFDPGRLEAIGEALTPYVDDGRLSGWLVTVAREGRLVYAEGSGYADRERGRPVEPGTIWRVYSMTKPVVALAALGLMEEGRFALDDEVSRWIPAFAEPRVFAGGSAEAPELAPATRPMTVRHLFSHTAGLTYGFQRRHPVDALYRAAGYDFLMKPGVDLAEAVDEWASLPLVFEPGTAFTYSVATTVLGRLVEIWSGEPLDVHLERRVFAPLGMVDTGFSCPEGKAERLAQLYLPGREGATPFEEWGRFALHPPRLVDGGGGLVSTAADYHRFMNVLVGRGASGEVTLVSPATFDLATTNQLPGGGDLATTARDRYGVAEHAGVGFGLGMSVVLDPLAARTPVSAGTLSWGGAASTTFFVDVLEGISAALYTQLLPTGTHPLHQELERAVYAARA
ncbi:MAG TPA: serine hydrolase domain-containing protein [Acidimicrobiales bacterium]|nr:serine hydrolase domain-containing protein [Acidimicrobiales bacterium]